MLKREERKEGHKGEHKEVGGRERRKREEREEEERREGREGERERKRDREAKNPSQHVVGTYTVFLQSDAVATIFSAARFCAATIQGQHLFLREPADINDGWIRYVHVVHCTYK